MIALSYFKPILEAGGIKILIRKSTLEVVSGRWALATAAHHYFKCIRGSKCRLYVVESWLGSSWKTVLHLALQNRKVTATICCLAALDTCNDCILLCLNCTAIVLYSTSLLACTWCTYLEYTLIFYRMRWHQQIVYALDIHLSSPDTAAPFSLDMSWLYLR